MSSTAMIPYTNAIITTDSRLRGRRDLETRGARRWGIILSPTPGRTLTEVYTSIGKVLETHANRMAHRLGLGPISVSQKIASFFGTGDQRVLQLTRMRNEIPAKMAKYCSRLMRYTFPTESPDTQCKAFQSIVTLTTLFPGVRLFLLPSDCTQEIPISTEHITGFWHHSNGVPDEEWSFWQTFAAACLSNASIFGIVEKTTVSQLTNCETLTGGLSVIEQLLVAHECEIGCSSTFSAALCIRYLGGILDLPGFWRNMGSVHGDVARKLCSWMARVLKDIAVDDIPSLCNPPHRRPQSIMKALTSWLT
ncbi:hypothetical protein C8R44DRAFT_362977 [Mycena epipterygia]|nr:hypothetical protein C8R44DRAFT_362977 [Mycena epipterygia]